MKRYQSAFAAPSGFVVAASAKSATKAGRRNEAVSRAADPSSATVPAKRPARDIRDRAA